MACMFSKALRRIQPSLENQVVLKKDYGPCMYMSSTYKCICAPIGMILSYIVYGLNFRVYWVLRDLNHCRYDFEVYLRHIVQ